MMKKKKAFRLTLNANVPPNVMVAEMTRAPHFFCLSGKQDYKKTKPVLRATRLKAEAKRSAPGIRVRHGCLSFSLPPPPS